MGKVGRVPLRGRAGVGYTQSLGLPSVPLFTHPASAVGQAKLALDSKACAWWGLVEYSVVCVSLFCEPLLEIKGKQSCM